VTGSFSTNFNGLEDGIEYGYRAVTEASNGDVSQGSGVTFLTADEPPAVVTESPSQVTDSNGTLTGSLNDLGNAVSEECYFEY